MTMLVINKFLIPANWGKEKLEVYKKKNRERNRRKSENHKRNRKLRQDYAHANGGDSPQIIYGKITSEWEKKKETIYSRPTAYDIWAGKYN